jgi:GNAT superfamily N-acetyltransferase
MKDIKVTHDEWGNGGQLRCVCKKSNVDFGYLNWRIENGSLQICDLLIRDSENRQQGMGSMLVTSVLELARTKGATLIWGTTQWDDEPVHRFYRKHGFYFDIEPGGKETRFSQPLS